jgi:hypothetical protein
MHTYDNAVVYVDRLRAVTDALAAAEAAGRYTDAASLRLAQRVLEGLIAEVAGHVIPAQRSYG